MTTQMNTTEQYFLVVLFTMLYQVVLTFESVDKTLKQLTATEQYFSMVLFTMLCKVVLTFEPVDKTAECDYSNKS